MKNIQIIDGALNCVYDIFSCSDDDFAAIFPDDTNIAFIDEVLEKSGNERVVSRLWCNPVKKAQANGIHGILFYQMDYKKKFYPTRRDEEAINPDGSQLRKIQ